MLPLLPPPHRLLKFEHQAQSEGFQWIIGVDEAGRGPLAGPVVASAVLLRDTRFANRIFDSKQITPRQRERAFHEIFDKAYVGIGIMSESVIDQLNILRATHWAMASAVRRLMAQIPAYPAIVERQPQRVCLLIDGCSFESDLPFCVKTIVRGDAQSLSIASASIVAKVYRDRLLACFDRIYPQYGFRQHKGYPTRQHRQAIQEHGLSPFHRKTFHVAVV